MCMLVDIYGCACNCVCTQVFTGLYVQNRERNRLYVWSSGSLHEWKQTTGAIKTDKWGQGSSPKVSAEHFSSHSSTKRTALHSPLLDGTANSFQMSVVYLAYWLNQLLQPTGTSHLPERQIWNFKTGDCSPLPLSRGCNCSLWRGPTCITQGCTDTELQAWRGNESKFSLKEISRAWVAVSFFF